ncbi:MAG: RcnB family protein [Pseudomonadota bacterium]|nr:RcnB family protein [Pseudomonadota bacterium]
MNKFLTTTVAALTALGTVASAIPAQAQSQWRDSDRDGRSDRSEWNQDRDRDGRPDQYDSDDRRDQYDNDDHRGEYGRNEHRGNAYGHYKVKHARHQWRDQRGRDWQYYGSNYGYNGYDGQWRTGQRYPYYQNRSYMVSDYGSYGLPAPRQGYRYFRDNNGDVIMAAIAGGVIGLIIGSRGR